MIRMCDDQKQRTRACPEMPAGPGETSVRRAGAGLVACRCCPGGTSRSRRRPRYPSDMGQAERAVCEPLLPAPAWLAGSPQVLSFAAYTVLFGSLAWARFISADVLS
jgi:hypothetical protein